jgi:HPt (histidine-containing phosphotransfer) domain-containing protein
MTGFQPGAVPEPQAFNGVLPALPEVAGLDLHTALGRMSGMRGLYVRTARDFISIMDNCIPELTRCLAAADWSTVLMHLHTLKGNAGTLGATGLAALAAKLETLCKSQVWTAECAQALESLSTLVQSTRKNLRVAITGLDQVPAESVAPMVDTTTMAAAMVALQKVAALAAASDMEALMCFAEVRDSLSVLPGNFADRLDQALQNLELDAAHTLCEDMLSAYPP